YMRPGHGGRCATVLPAQELCSCDRMRGAHRSSQGPRRRHRSTDHQRIKMRYWPMADRLRVTGRGPSSLPSRKRGYAGTTPLHRTKFGGRGAPPPPTPSPVSTFDFIVIGSGPAGRRAAIQAAKLGRSVLVVEKGRRVGGVSVHTGTIPSKTLRETVLNLSGWRERGFYGLAYRVKKDIEGKDLGVRLRMTLDHEIEVLEHQFARNGVKTFAGVAKFADPHRLVVRTTSEEHSFAGDKIVIAVGTAPFRPAGIPFNGRNVFD